MADVKRLLWSARNKKSGYSKIPSLAVGKKKWLHTKQNQRVQKELKKVALTYCYYSVAFVLVHRVP